MMLISRSTPAILAMVMSASAWAQTGATPPTAPTGNQAPAMGTSTEATGAGMGVTDSSTMFQGIMDPFEYDQRGRRDPFVQPVPDKPVEQGNIHGPLLALQKFELSKLTLVGIIWDVKRPKAMIKDPTGSTHVVGTNTKVGPHNGYIAVIRERSISNNRVESADTQPVA